MIEYYHAILGYKTRQFGCGDCKGRPNCFTCKGNACNISPPLIKFTCFLYTYDEDTNSIKKATSGQGDSIKYKKRICRVKDENDIACRRYFLKAICTP